MTYKIRFCLVEDASAIMAFMHEHWKENHILSISLPLLLRDFQDNDRLNIAIAESVDKKIVGLFGFIKYSQSALPDIGGSLWRVIPEAEKKQPMLGIQLRNYVIKNIPHRLFSAPGAGLQTQPIYHLLKMNFCAMEQWYWLNPNILKYQIVKAKGPGFLISLPTSMHKGDELYLLECSSQVDEFSFIDNYYPYKDSEYVKKRFFNYPFYSYDLYFYRKKGRLVNLIVLRKAKYKNACLYRLVDFYGEDTYISEIIYLLSNYVIHKGYEGLDWLCLGLNHNIMAASGLTLLDFSSSNVIIPNFFQPFVRNNVLVYSVFDKSDRPYRQFKADGDQDRPNEVVRLEHNA